MRCNHASFFIAALVLGCLTACGRGTGSNPEPAWIPQNGASRGSEVRSLVYDSTTGILWAGGYVRSDTRSEQQFLRKKLSGSSWTFASEQAGNGIANYSNVGSVLNFNFLVNGKVHGILPTTGGTLLSLGGQPNTWEVFKSTDGGTLWYSADKVENMIVTSQPGADLEGTLYPILAHGMAKSSTGIVYVAGYTQPKNEDYQWYVRKSLDGGTTFSDSDKTTNPNIAYAVATYANSAVYVVGANVANDLTWTWIVRKSTDQGTTWTTVDTFFLPSTIKDSRPLGVTTDSSGNVFVVGRAFDGANIRWIVRKSSNGGTNWSTVDDFLHTGSAASYAAAIAVDSSDRIYVVGTDLNRWLVRKSVDGGSTWSTVDSYQYLSPRPSRALSVAIGASSEVYVGGWGMAADGTKVWIVRKSTDQGTTWSTDDEYQFPH